MPCQNSNFKLSYFAKRFIMHLCKFTKLDSTILWKIKLDDNIITTQLKFMTQRPTSYSTYLACTSCGRWSDKEWRPELARAAHTPVNGCAQ